MVVMSGCKTGICFKFLVSKLVLISRIDLEEFGFEEWVEG